MSIKSRLQALADRYDRRRREREERRKLLEPFVDRVNEIRSAPNVTKSDLYCTVCNRDFSGIASKQVSSVRTMLPTAWYVGKCPKGHKAIRYITDKLDDPYYNLSLLVARQRYDMRDDFLDPSDPRFKVLYPEAYKRLMTDARQKSKN
jgi:hypothetical protein